jgi:hypothetical protein
MKFSILPIAVVLFLFSCEANKEENKTIQTVNPDEIRLGEIVHDSLSEDQIKKITRIQSVFSDVYPVSLEESISNFKNDLNPDNEIHIWLMMADAYENYLNSKQQTLDLETRKEVFKLILSRSMMPLEDAITNANLSILTKNEAEEVLKFYNMDAAPVKVLKK